MIQPAPAPDALIEAIRDFYAALNRGDVAAVLAHFDADGAWVEEPPEFPPPGTYSGEALAAHLTETRETWAEGACEPEDFVPAGDRIVTLVHVRVRLKGNTEWNEGDIADVFTARDGRVIEVRTFADRARALAWASADG